jgi:hypothetical protein
MNIKRLLNSDMGRVFISILLGLGLATLFRKVCKDKNCIKFSGPVIGDIEGKTYKYGDKCYTYTSNPTKCDDKKKVVDISHKVESLDLPIGGQLPATQMSKIFG